jgi:hypothetical protein
MQTDQLLDAYDLVSDPELRRAAAKTLKGFYLTYLPHHFPLCRGGNHTERLSVYQRYIFYLGVFVATHIPTLTILHEFIP